MIHGNLRGCQIQVIIVDVNIAHPVQRLGIHAGHRVSPGGVHIIVFPVQLDKIPGVGHKNALRIFRIAGDGGARDAHLFQQILSGKGIALAHGLSV